MARLAIHERLNLAESLSKARRLAQYVVNTTDQQDWPADTRAMLLQLARTVLALSEPAEGDWQDVRLVINAMMIHKQPPSDLLKPDVVMQIVGYARELDRRRTTLHLRAEAMDDALCILFGHHKWEEDPRKHAAELALSWCVEKLGD